MARLESRIKTKKFGNRLHSSKVLPMNETQEEMVRKNSQGKSLMDLEPTKI